MVKLQKSTLHAASCEASDSTKERLKFGKLLVGSGQPEYKGSDTTICFTNHCHMVQSWPLNHEQLRFSQNCQLFNALIFIISSFYHSISAPSTEKVNVFLHNLKSKPILTHLKVFEPLKSKFDIFLSVWSLKLHEINILSNKHIKIHKIRYS